MTDDDRAARAQAFGQRVAEAARSAGYDIDSPRGGGKKELARRTGMTQSSVGRMLAGQTMPDAYRLEALANAVNMPVEELLVLHGIISPETNLSEAPRKNLTVPELAEMWGITDPHRVKFLGALVDFLLEEQRRSDVMR
ncbi:helix-turn-helix domain-containing protein [Streptomyces sp. NBC_00390]|uniref:helix-turn-helix domain-containing protein n=1 Tax=Streptomyces sp. NBC_00390 TaxID=2975736 RepID=UPI002E1FDB77